MKKLIVVFVLLLALISANSTDAKAMGVIIKIGRGVAWGEDCRPGNGICFIIILTRTASNIGTARSGAGTDVELIDGTAELKDGKLYVTTSKPISDQARNDRGSFEIAVKENAAKQSLVIDPAVAKELGVESLVADPGTYSFQGNTIVFNTVKSPKDVTKGQASGKQKEYVGHVTLMK